MTEILQQSIDEVWMRYAIRLAQRAQQHGEIPGKTILTV
jgi:hypothetical protein